MADSRARRPLQPPSQLFRIPRSTFFYLPRSASFLFVSLFVHVAAEASMKRRNWEEPAPAHRKRDCACEFHAAILLVAAIFVNTFVLELFVDPTIVLFSGLEDIEFDDA